MSDYLKLAEEVLEIAEYGTPDPYSAIALAHAIRELHEENKELEAENELLAGDSVGVEKRLGEEVARLREEIERKDEALEFYADLSNGALEMGRDAGKRARAALSPTPEAREEE